MAKTELKKYISYRVPRKNIGTRSRTNFTLQHLDNPPRLIEEDKYYYFVKDNTTGDWFVPQYEKANDIEQKRMTLIFKRIYNFFKPTCSAKNINKDFNNPEFLKMLRELIVMEKKYSELKITRDEKRKSEEKILSLHHEERRKEQLPSFAKSNVYSTNWKVVKYYQLQKKIHEQQQKTIEGIKKLGNKGYKVILSTKKV